MILGPRQAGQLRRELPDPLRYESFPVRDVTQGRKSTPVPSAVDPRRYPRRRCRHPQRCGGSGCGPRHGPPWGVLHWPHPRLLAESPRTVCDLLDRAPLESLASNGWLSPNGLRRPRHRMPGPDPSFNSGAAFPSDLRPRLLVTARGMVAYTQSLVPKRPSVALLKGLFHDGLDAFDSLSGNPGHSINGTASDLFRRLESSRCYRRSCFLDADTYIARRLHRSHDGTSGHPMRHRPRHHRLPSPDP